MAGLVARAGRPVLVVRTAIEVPVLGLGRLLGGNFRLGTLPQAVAVGPLVQPPAAAAAGAGAGRAGPGDPLPLTRL
jgi:uncharacterized membrane protein YczE